MKIKNTTKEEVLDQYFPKGSKKRGEAMALCVVAYLEGKDKMIKFARKLQARVLTHWKGQNELIDFIEKELEK